jgi:2-succinyl-5-enolpyruvyl-6-hydroxy-3-cyclohexene-1-carboxylate synthase
MTAVEESSYQHGLMCAAVAIADGSRNGRLHMVTNAPTARRLSSDGDERSSNLMVVGTQ